MNARRTFLAALGAGAFADALDTFAQVLGKPLPKIWRVGFIWAASRATTQRSLDTILRKLREMGYVEGRDFTTEHRWADGNATLLPGFAAELVSRKVDLIVTYSTEAAQAAKAATRDIPVVFTMVSDPVASSVVNSLARPGGNVTGNSNNSADIAAKQLQVLLEIAPKVKRVAVLLNPDNRSSAAILSTIVTTAQKKAGVTILPSEARTAPAIESAFALMKQVRAEALMLTGDGMFHGQLPAIAALAIKQRLPSVALIRQYADTGGLMSYGSSFRENYRRAAYYVDRIFKGAKPADLPVEEPTRFELLINGKTAKALGLKIPQSLLIMAEKVIE